MTIKLELPNGYEAEVNVTHFLHVPGDHTCWDSDLDYHGFTECDWEVLSMTDEEGRQCSEEEKDDMNDLIGEMVVEVVRGGGEG